jgi:hypothetical protein
MLILDTERMLLRQTVKKPSNRAGRLIYLGSRLITGVIRYVLLKSETAK